MVRLIRGLGGLLGAVVVQAGTVDLASSSWFAPVVGALAAIAAAGITGYATWRATRAAITTGRRKGEYDWVAEQIRINDGQTQRLIDNLQEEIGRLRTVVQQQETRLASLTEQLRGARDGK